MAMRAYLTPEQKRANRQASLARYRETLKGHAHVDLSDAATPPPPRYVLKEREIRRQIPPASFTAKALGDPLPGYSGQDNKQRHLSVQDALEICALHTGRRGDVLALATTYGVTSHTILNVLDGSWFDHLLPLKQRFREPDRCS